MQYLLQFSATLAVAFFVSFIGTDSVRRIASAGHFVDIPDADRKIHRTPTPLLGGVALYLAFITAIAFALASGWLQDPRVPYRLLVAICASGAVLVCIGALDDRYRLRWWQQLAGPIAASMLMIAAGLEIPFVTNPFGAGVLDLGKLGIGGAAFPLGTILVFLWILGMIYTTKLLDGIDGLTTSVSLVASTVLFIVSLFWDRSGSTTSFLALALAGALLGFLIWNWYPAKIFLGEGGSTLIGFLLAVLAIVSGGKIATALLVMGIPILDVVWIMLRRLRARQPLTVGDQKHLHFRLLAAGLSQRQVVLFLSCMSLLFGSVSFFFGTTAKLIALAALVVVMVLLTKILTKQPHEKDIYQ